jgi:uroporphyrinogen decarboxylase
MNSKERVLCAVALGEPDRPPLDIHPNPFVAERIQREWGINDYREMLRRLGSDIVDLRSTVNPHYRGPVPLLQTHPDGTRENFWGWRTKIMQTACGPEEIYSEFVLANAESVEDLAAHRWPSPDWFDFSDFAERLKPWEDFAVMATGASVWQHPSFLRSLEALSMDLVAEPEMAAFLLEKFTDFYVNYFDRMLTAANGRIDLLRIADDIGTQQGLMFSPQVFREMFAPRITRIIDMAHSHGVKVMFHSCGAIIPLIDDIIACGADILDPLQACAKGMDPQTLKDRFGSRICLHGGIDTQHLLPNGTPEQVAAETRRVTEILTRGGGAIIAPCHVVQMDVPTANLEAMRDAGWRHDPVVPPV